MKISTEMMEDLLTRKQLVWLGVLAIILGLVFFVLSYFFITNTVKSVTSIENKGDKHVTQDVCMSSLRGVSGLTVRPDGKDIIVLSSVGLEDASLKLGEASVASLVCPGWKLLSFCMGESCKDGEGLLLELQVIK